MAGISKRIVSNADFTPDESIDFSRDWKTKRKDWREAEKEIYGKEYIETQEKRIKLNKTKK